MQLSHFFTATKTCPNHQQILSLGLQCIGHFGTLLLLYNQFCYGLFFLMCLCYCPHHWTTFSELRHVFRNSQTALSLTHCILHNP